MYDDKRYICYKFISFNEESRQRGRFAGFLLFVSNNGSLDSSFLCYKDGPQLPPLNFTTTCISSGRYVTFYNERFDGPTYPEGYERIAYTELCEVIVQGISNKLMPLHNIFRHVIVAGKHSK